MADDETTTPPPRPIRPRRRPGSETRRKQYRVTYRLSEPERRELEQLADRAGQTLATYSRSRVLAAPATRPRYRPPVNLLVFTRLLTELNRIGGNINQIARHLNFGGTPVEGDIRAALADVQEVVAALHDALGREGAR
jgi:hypothetical protein